MLCGLRWCVLLRLCGVVEVLCVVEFVWSEVGVVVGSEVCGVEVVWC